MKKSATAGSSGYVAVVEGAGGGVGTEIAAQVAEKSLLLGGHIIGAHASDLIAKGALAVETAAHIEDLELTIHAHPTLAERVGEGAQVVEKKAIHIFQAKSGRA